jgi:putative nucleotidyltransferase with HDIG domain
VPRAPEIVMPKSLRVYISCLSVLAAALLYLTYAAGEQPSAHVSASIAGILWLIAIGLGAEALALDFKIGSAGYNARSSLAFLPFLAALGLYSITTAVLIIGVVAGISSFVLRRAGLWRGLFNISQGIIVGSVAGSVFAALFDSTPEFSYLALVGGFIGLASAFFVVNMLLSSVAIALMKGTHIVSVVRQVVGAGGGNLLYDLLASPIALVMMLLQMQHGVAGSVALMLPLLLIQYSYQSNRKVLEQAHDILSALVKAIETRDPYTSGHSERVAGLARAVATDLRLPPRRVHQVVTAALLHDIGKIHEEYSAVLRKPHSLTAEERALIETHAARGADLLAQLETVPKDVVAAVRHHHERFDGQGYPDKLSGDAIPLTARIIMMCDSIDAMLSDRPYRRALSVSHVKAELARCSGTQFDPHIVQTVLRKDTLGRIAASHPVESPITSTGRSQLVAIAQ